jgi:serine/threonine protein kinase
MERFDQYLLLKRVGSGGMAELFKAKKVGIEGFERVVAIKRILPHLSSDEEFIEMFIAEAKLAARLSQRNIVQIYDFGKIDESYFIAMEYVPGKDLRTILKRCKARNMAFPLPLAVYIAKEVACGLNTAHNQKDNNGKSLNIIHRDISPQNILISYDGEVKVVDFGIAKAGTHSKTSTGVLKGKVSYMSPEQAWGKPVDQRSDIFSLGLCLYEMLTGEKLFKGDTEINTLEKVREVSVDRRPSSLNHNVSSDIEAPVLKALAKEPNQRYQTARDMETELNATLRQISHLDPPLQLRQFMYELFPTEIEEEQWEDVDQTVYEPNAQDYVARSRSGQTGRKEERSGAVAASGSPGRRRYVYAIAAVLVAVVVALGAVYFVTRSPGPPRDLRASAQALPQQPVPAAPQQPVPAAPQQPQPAAPQQPVPAVSPAPIGAPMKGTLNVSATPWANVYIGGKNYGRTPQTIDDLTVGTHTVRLENPNFEVWETTVKILRKGAVKVHHDFAGFGKIVVNAKPWANVYLDGNLKGQTPITIPKVPSGEHHVKIVREGYAEITRTITVKSSEENSISVPLQKIEN